MKFSKEILKWKLFSPEKLRLAGITNHFQISKDGGTGGGIFRKMYGEFLIEATNILNDERFTSLGKRFLNISELWDNLADEMWELSLKGDVELLKKMSEEIQEIYKIEKDLYLSLKDIIV